MPHFYFVFSYGLYFSLLYGNQMRWVKYACAEEFAIWLINALVNLCLRWKIHADNLCM